jgi:non-ribosomal peptide synthetase-like protein
MALVSVAAVQVLLVKWTLLGRLKPGTYDYPGFTWLRKWFCEKHLELCSPLIVPLYDSLFTRPWCIALGMKCGPRCEIALPRRMPYDLVEMGAESFLASEVSIGRPIRRNGKIFLERTIVGTRAFLGNDSVVPQGCHVPDEFLLGVLSVCPSNDQVKASENGHDQAWLGSPAFRMPNRQVMDSFDPTQTYKPTTSLYVQRLAHETARVVLPGLCQLIVASILVEGFVLIWNEHTIAAAVLAIPLLYLLGALIGAGICWLSKKLFIGTYRPTIQPLWSQFVWKTETHSAILHDFGAPLFITTIIGTPYVSAFMRFLGCTVGDRAFINSTDWTESDLISIGEDAAINANAPLQAHLFEDRVMKVGPIKVGDRCSVGNYSVILCESELKNDAHVGHLSLVMKGETIPSHTFWAGSPAQACDDVDFIPEPGPTQA